MLVAQACAFNAVPISTAYDSLGPEGLKHALKETEVHSMFTNADLLPTLLKVIEKTETVKVIVYDGEADPKIIEDLKNVREGMKVVTLDEVVEIGKRTPLKLSRRTGRRCTVACILVVPVSSHRYPW